jgi:hypothetical protein
MLLCEFVEDDPLRLKLVGVTSQLKARMKDTSAKKKLNTDALVALLHDNDIMVSKADLFDMIKQVPLKNIIKNIKGDEVIFVGQKEDDDIKEPDDKSEKAVEKMAKRAAKK